MPRFGTIHRDLRDTIEKKDQSRETQEKLDAEINELNPFNYDLSNRMAEAIRSGDVGKDEPEAACYLTQKPPAPKKPASLK